MDAAKFLADFQDHLGPRLDVYEQAVYLYVVRHSRMLGLNEVVIGFKSARSAMAFGIGKAGSPMSENSCYLKLRSLADKGCLELLGTVHGGTKLRAFLPDEIVGVIPLAMAPTTLTLEEMDFFGVPENRALILRREDARCFYCLREIDENSFVIEHVVSRPEGSNSYRNVVAACRQCNNRKGQSLAEDFLRTLYRENLLTSEEFDGRMSHLENLRSGQLRPVLANKALNLTGLRPAG
jgi:hypothetical protein